MALSEKQMIEERDRLQVEFDTVRKEMMQMETQLGQIRSNLNALNGAIQQTNRMIGMLNSEKKDEEL